MSARRLDQRPRDDGELRYHRQGEQHLGQRSHVAVPLGHGARCVSIRLSSIRWRCIFELTTLPLILRRLPGLLCVRYGPHARRGVTRVHMDVQLALPHVGAATGCHRLPRDFLHQFRRRCLGQPRSSSSGTRRQHSPCRPAIVSFTDPTSACYDDDRLSSTRQSTPNSTLRVLNGSSTLRPSLFS